MPGFKMRAPASAPVRDLAEQVCRRHIVVLGEARAVDVARGTRTAVAECLTRTFPEATAPAHIAVTVTGLL
ncbi:hypothetical protein [[Kitasatospora] papulosa]|uniref:hypothetical protein n=1 Tax=[Kitasatospora] papulosa TaxID=1464011 RepID=UPI0036AEA199